jgi:hypothetical protein
MDQVFTSYSSRDVQVVETIVGKMSQAGLRVWLDREEIKAGNAWSVQIVEAIDTCPAFVLMLSPNSAASKEVHQEVYLSHESRRAMYVVMLEPVKVPNEIRYQLAGKQILSVERRGLDEVIDELIETVREYVAQFEPVEPPQNRQVELVIQGLDLKDLTPEKQAQVLDLLSQLTGSDRSQLQITKLAAGSVHIFVDMPRRAAYEVKTAALNRDPRFKQLGIASLRLDGDRKFVNVSTGTLGIAATTSPLMALWLKIPALLAPVVGATVGKVLTVSVAAALVAVVGFSASAALDPLLNPSPTPTPFSTLTPTPPPAATDTLTPTDVPTQTGTYTATITPTGTETATSTPSLTPVPTYAILQGDLISRVACRYGPGDFYLYRFGLIPGNRMEVRGRAELRSGRQTQSWLWGLPEFFPDVCWVNAGDVKLNGDVASLEEIYPGKVDLPFIRDARWPVPQNVEVERLGDQVTISWDFFDVPEGEREGPNSPRYLLEVWLCQNGEVTFTPLPVYENTKIAVIDQAGCIEPSHGRIILAEKHGYVGPVEIKWPPHPVPTP